MLRIRLVVKHFIHFLIGPRDNHVWEITTMHASKNHRIRQNLWSNLDMIEVCRPWLLIGDFNCTLYNVERCFDGGISTSFSRWVDRRGLLDLGYIRPRFTCIHGHNMVTRRTTRLDWGLCDEERRRRFPEASITHLPPLLL